MAQKSQSAHSDESDNSGCLMTIYGLVNTAMLVAIGYCVGRAINEWWVPFGKWTTFVWVVCLLAVGLLFALGLIVTLLVFVGWGAPEKSKEQMKDKKQTREKAKAKELVRDPLDEPRKTEKPKKKSSTTKTPSATQIDGLSHIVTSALANLRQDKDVYIAPDEPDCASWQKLMSSFESSSGDERKALYKEVEKFIVGWLFDKSLRQSPLSKYRETGWDKRFRGFPQALQKSVIATICSRVTSQSDFVSTLGFVRCLAADEQLPYDKAWMKFIESTAEKSKVAVNELHSELAALEISEPVDVSAYSSLDKNEDLYIELYNDEVRLCLGDVNDVIAHLVMWEVFSHTKLEKTNSELVFSGTSESKMYGEDVNIECRILITRAAKSYLVHGVKKIK